MGLQYGLEVVAVQNRGKAGEFGKPSCALLLLKYLFFRRKQVESCCLYKLSRWTGAAGNRLVFPLRAGG